jgi:hypothetical protein
MQLITLLKSKHFFKEKQVHQISKKEKKYLLHEEWFNYETLKKLL